VIEDGSRIEDISLLSQSLAALAYTTTLSSKDIPDLLAIELRRSSRDLFATLSGDAPDSSEAIELIGRIRKAASAPEFTSSINPDKRTSLFELSQSIQGILQERDRHGANPRSEEQLAEDHLKGAVVIITRPQSQSEETATVVERHGGIPVIMPLIEIADPHDWYPADYSIVNLKGYDGVIFTSQNAVERFLGRIGTVNALAHQILASRRVYAVGSKTRACLETAQIPVTLTPERSSAADLVTALLRNPVAGKRFLFPKGNIAKEEIPEMLRASDAVVDEVEVYRTVTAEGSSLAPLAKAVSNGEVDSVVFFSPSALVSFAGAIDAGVAAQTVIACIGPATTRAAESAGYRNIVTSDDATAESMVESLVRYFKR
jgi:uroporphyrinogen-III synthase